MCTFFSFRLCLLHRFLSIPFPSPLLASQAFQIISPDKELKDNLVKRTIVVDGSKLNVNFGSVSARMMRIAVNAFLENLDLVVTAMYDLAEYCQEE